MCYVLCALCGKVAYNNVVRARKNSCELRDCARDHHVIAWQPTSVVAEATETTAPTTAKPTTSWFPAIAGTKRATKAPFDTYHEYMEYFCTTTNWYYDSWRSATSERAEATRALCYNLPRQTAVTFQSVACASRPLRFILCTAHAFCITFHAEECARTLLFQCI